VVKLFVLILSFSFLVWGCTSTYYLTSFTDTKDEFEGEMAVIKLTSGEEI